MDEKVDLETEDVYKLFCSTSNNIFIRFLTLNSFFSLKDGRHEVLDSPRSYHHLLKNYPVNISFIVVKFNTGVVCVNYINATREAAPIS